MNKCNNCGVSVYASERDCPLCHAPLDISKYKEKTATSYPKYDKIINSKFPLRNLPMFVALTAMVVCIYINIFTYDSGEILWALIVSVGVMFASGVFYTVKSKKERYGAKVVLIFVMLSVLVFVVDFTTGMLLWSTNYVFPFLTLATAVYLTVLAVRSRRLFSEYFGFILTVAVIGFIPIPVYFFGFSNRAWGMFVAVISCLIIALGLFLFSDKTFKQEIYKRFHR